MTPENDLVEFSERIVVFGELFDVKFSAARIGLYFEALRDLEFAEVVRALNTATRTCKFLPKPAELREIVLGDPTEAEEAAWVLFREAMQRHGAYVSVVAMDPALGEAVRTMFGSWPAACATDLSPEMWANKRKEWARVYTMLARRGGRPAYLPGLTEMANSGRADWEKYTPLVVIEGTTMRALSPAEAGARRAALTQAALPMATEA